VTAVLGVDVGGTSTKWVVLDGAEVAVQGRFDTPAEPETLAARLTEALAAGGAPRRVGVALPAVLGGGGRRIAVAPNLPSAWVGTPLADTLSACLERPVTLCNDARAFALAESRRGAGRDRRVVVALTLGTGVGAATGCAIVFGVILGTGVGGGVVVDGAVLPGRAGLAGELGHLVVDPDGPRCGCGARGCLEAYAGGRSMLTACAANGRSFGTVAALVAAARDAGDDAALGVLSRAGAALGRALLAVAAVVAPDLVVLGGGVSAAYDLLEPSLEAALAAGSPATPALDIRRSTLGDHAGAIGAALWKGTNP
jgi:glucokinase